MSTLQEDLENLKRAWLDLAYIIGRDTKLVWLVEKIPGLQLKPWVRDRERR